jgi:uncharacterized membrane protein YgcG
MKRTLFFLIALALLLSAAPVNAQGGVTLIPDRPSNSYILDTLNWLSESQEQEINTIVRQLDSEGRAQIYVATLDNCGSNKTQYRRDIFNAWNIGAQKGNGGLLILVCWYGGDESRRSVEVRTDEKMQNVIPDALTATTAETNFVPAFKENQPGAGLVKMVTVFDNMIRAEGSTTAPRSPTSQVGIGPILLLMLAIIMLPIILFRNNKSSGEGGWYGGDGGGGDGGGGDGGGSSTSF